LNLILDSSSTINLHNGDVFGVALELVSEGFRFHMGTIVRGECGGLSSLIENHVRDGRLTILQGRAISAAQFARLLNKYELGLGETECIAHAEQHSLIVCTDDNAARRATADHLGAGKVVGSLALMRECVCSELITSHAAYVTYELMRARGAFLPEIAASYFDC